MFILFMICSLLSSFTTSYTVCSSPFLSSIGKIVSISAAPVMELSMVRRSSNFRKYIRNAIFEIRLEEVTAVGPVPEGVEPSASDMTSSNENGLFWKISAS